MSEAQEQRPRDMALEYCTLYTTIDDATSLTLTACGKETILARSEMCASQANSPSVQRVYTCVPITNAI